LTGFAANSLLCRAALGSGAIDAWSFTAVRLGAGAAALGLLQRLMAGRAGRGGASVSADRASTGSFTSALALYAYAGAFSLAYLRLPTGVGALVLFACVQATMLGWSIARGARPTASEWIGLCVAGAGLVLLALPGATKPDALGLALMAVAGIAWGVYSLRGRGIRSPLAATSGNFARSLPMALIALFAASLLGSLRAQPRGVGLALASGALASGLGYSLWYLALPGLSATRAALVQLLVPVFAAAGGILLLGENLSPRIGLSGGLILGGVGVAVLVRGSARGPRGAPVADRPPR
jgi:drug/metabolite transporter (DMT)-like permease